jgi:hypothetical protein
VNGTPLNPAGDGRGSAGRFAAGNRFGRGNPTNRRAQQIRGDLLREATREDRKAIARALIDKARSGDVVAIREFYDRTAGKPAPQELLERIEQLEQVVGAKMNGETR